MLLSPFLQRRQALQYHFVSGIFTVERSNEYCGFYIGNGI
jgi:hypothetical protein